MTKLVVVEPQRRRIAMTNITREQKIAIISVLALAVLGGAAAYAHFYARLF